MKSSTLIVWLLVAAFIAIDLAIIGELQVRQNEWPEAGGIAGFGLAFSQLCLVATWVVWGTWNPLVRTVVALCCVWGLSLFLSFSNSRDSPITTGQWFSVSLIYLAITLVPLAAANFIGYTLKLNDETTTTAAGSRTRSRQFTIWNLLSIMTALAVILGALRHVELLSWNETRIDVLINSVLAITASVMLLLSFLDRRTWRTVLVGLILTPGAGYLLSLSAKRLILEVTLMTGVMALSVFVSAKILSIGGYQLVRDFRPKFAKKSESSGASELARLDRDDEP